MGRDPSEKLEHPAYDINEHSINEHSINEHSRVAVEAAAVGTWDWNVTTDEVYWNEQHFRLFGMEPQAQPVTPEVFFSHVYTEDKDWLSERLLGCRDNHEVFEAEFRIVLEDGKMRWMHGNGQVTGEENGQTTRMSGVMTDITERKQSEEKVLESEVHFRTLAERLPFIVSLAYPDGRIEYINPFWATFSGRSLEDFINGDWLNAVHPEDQLRVLESWQTALVSGQPYKYEFRALSKDGSYRWLLARGEPIRNELGEITRWVNTAIDIHDRKEAEEKVREGELRQAYLLELSDALRPLADAVEIQGAVTRTALNYFGADRCYYCELENDNAVIRRDALAQSLPSVANVYPLENLPALKAVLEAGRPFVVENVYTSELVDEPLRQLCIEMQIISYLDVPVIKDGKPVGVLCITLSTPRAWTDVEIDLAVETAERTWAAVERAKAQRTLHESEEKYRTLFETIDEGYCLIEMMYDEAGKPVDFRYLETNQVVERQTGLSGVVGKRLLEVAPNAEPMWLDFYGRVASTGKAERMEIRTDAVDGRWFTVFASRVRGESSRFVAVIFSDITERKEREQRQEFLLKFSDALRAETNADDVANRALEMLCEQLRLDRCYIGVYKLAEDWGEFTHQVGNDQVPPVPDGVRLSDFPDALRVAHDQTLVIGDIVRMENLSNTDRQNIAALGYGALVAATLRKGENRPLWAIVAVSAGPRHWTENEITLIEEVTERTWAALERVRTEEKLKKSEAQLQALVSNLPGGAAFVVDHNLRYLLAEGEALTSAGFNSQDFVGKTIFEALSPEVAASYEPLYRKALTGVGFEHEHDSHNRAYITRGVPLRSANGEIYAVLAISYDITERKRSEDILQKSEERFRRVVDSRPVGVLFANMEGQITQANTSLLEMLGATPDWLIGKQWQDLTPSEYAERDAQAEQELLSTGTVQPYEKEYIRMDGSRLPILMAATMLRTDGDFEAVGFVLDYSERKKAQEVLRWFEAIVASSQDAILSFDLEGKALSWNPGAEEIFGYQAEEMIGTSLSKLAEKEREHEQLELLEKLKRGERITQLETVRRRKGGETFAAMLTLSPIKNERGDIVAATGVIQDITERKQTQEALRKSEEHFRLLVESATDYAIFTMDLSGHINSWNRGAERIFGYSEEEIMGQSGAVLFTPEDRARGVPEQELQTALNKGRAADERYHLRKGGEAFFASGVTTQLRNHHTKGFVKIARDLSERKQMEDALREADKRKDEFLAILAHELRNPLAPIRTSLEILKRTKNKELEDEAKAVIGRQINQLVHLVDDLLDVSRFSRGKIKLHEERVDLHEIVALALESTKPLIEEKEHDLQVSLPFKNIELYGDKTRLAQVLLNLLSNAAKYTRPGGKISVSAVKESDALTLRVTDTGMGISAKDLPHVFDLFMRVERDGGAEGLGIGLNLVKQLVERHGGTVEAFSKGEGQGSEFTVRLPLAGQKPQAGQAVSQLSENKTPRESDQEMKTSQRVLIVDDYEPNRKTLARLLRLMGHEVITASGGEEGLRFLEEFNPEVVLLDLNMPGINGFETAKRIREIPRLRQLKLIALTGYGQEQDRELTKQAGFDAHLVKPVDVETLEQLLGGKG
jgi:PAS domain S-box-containing protein